MPETANIILFGPGLIGQTLLESLINAIERFRSPLKIIGVVDSRGAVMDIKGFTPTYIHELVKQKQRGCSLSSIDGSIPPKEIVKWFSPKTILVDTTDSDSIYKTLLQGLAQDCSITMSNKKNLVRPWPVIEGFFNSSKVRFESTVCAGTPIIATIQNLIDSIDEVQSIEGCLSGTLNFICSKLDNGITMAKAIEDAHDFGYTEPDPRDDLNGKDVGRKALILARMVGWHLEMKDISIEQLYPHELGELTKEDFFHRLFMLTPKYQQLAHHAAAEAMSLRYIATITPKGGRCYMKAVSKDSEFGLLKGPANKVSIHSRVHNPIPLTISGAGAGADVTVLGLLSDILALADKIVH